MLNTHIAPVPPDEPERLRALAECGVLNTPDEVAFDDLTSLASRLTGCPIAMVSLMDRDRQWFKSRIGTDAAETSREVAFCAHALLRDKTLIIRDATQDEIMRTNPLVTGAAGIRFYAGVPLRTSDGYALGTLCVVDTRPRDLTPEQIHDLETLAHQALTLLELRRTASHLRAAERRAVEASEKKAAFLANMSHEIRTPLTSVLGYLDVMLEPNATPELRNECAHTIKRSADHLLGLINDLLDFSKIESGHMRIEPTSCCPALKVWEVVHMFSHAAKSKGVRLDAAFATPIPKWIICDRLRFRQILVNLVSNAIKFTATGSISITASVVPVNGSTELHIAVADTGIGMTPQQMDRLYDPFTQGEIGTARRFGGTGLGMAISKRLADLLGGTLSVNSAPGVGTTFVFSMPIDPGACDDCVTDWRDAPQLRPNTPPATPSVTGRVLVAEDGLDNQRLIAHLLSKVGFQVEIVSDGGAAITRALESQPPFDLILMDLQMPVVDGFQAVEQLRRAGYRGPIAALTASASVEVRDRCLAVGCTDFLTKPIDRNALIETCGRLIQCSRPVAQAA